MTFENIVLVVGGTLTGLLAGVFYAFNVAIIPALRNLKGKQHIAVMQSINVKIKNPIFFISFLGPGILLPLAAFLHRGETQFPLLAAAALLHIIGANGITIAGNIPLNDKLEKIDVDQLSEAAAEQIRNDFQGSGTPWMRFHAVRTFAATAAAALVLVACLFRSASE